MSEPPPSHVLSAFGVAAVPEPLPGGRGRSWRAGPLVLKPLDWLPDELAYQAEILGTIRPDGFRVAVPLPEVVDGWTASPYLEGSHEPPDSPPSARTPSSRWSRRWWRRPLARYV